MNTIKWDMVGAVFTGMALLVAVIVGREQLLSFSARGWFWVLWWILFLFSLLGIYIRRQGVRKIFKFRPRLVIEMRDISCFVEPTLEIKSGPMSDSRKSFIEWQPQLIVEIKNKGWARATNIDCLIGFSAASQYEREYRVRQQLNLEKGESIKINVAYSPEKLDLSETFKLYPNGSYVITFYCSCDECFGLKSLFFKSLGFRKRGRFSKANWIGDPDTLRAIQNMGTKK